MLRLRELLDLLLVGFVGLAVFGTLLLMALTNRVCLILKGVGEWVQA
jgi:hypothetical protein